MASLFATMPDIEPLLVSGLSVGVPVMTRVPNEESGDGDVPDEFVRVERVGGVQQSRISDLPNVVAEAWAQTEERAGELMVTLRQALQALRGTTLGSSRVMDVSESGGVVNLPDPDGRRIRYTITVSIHVRGNLA